MEDVLFFRRWMRAAHRFVAAPENADVFDNVLHVQEPGFDAVVEIRGEIGDLVGKVNNLRLEWRPLGQEILSELRMLFVLVIARVLDDALPRGKRQVQPWVSGIALFKLLDNPQSMQIVVEAEAVALETGVERALSRMPKRWMADVVRKGQRLRQVNVQSQRGCNLPCHLCDFDRVGEPAAEVIGRSSGEYLGLPCQPAERARLHNAVTVALERRAPVSGRRGIGAYGEPMLFGAENAAGVEIKFH